MPNDPFHNIPIACSGIVRPSTGDFSKPLPKKERWGTLKGSPVVGRLIRGQFRQEVRAAAFRLGIELQLDEEKGFLDSTFLLKAEGPEGKIREFEHWLNQLMELNSKPS